MLKFVFYVSFDPCSSKDREQGYPWSQCSKDRDQGMGSRAIFSLPVLKATFYSFEGTPPSSKKYPELPRNFFDLGLFLTWPLSYLVYYKNAKHGIVCTQEATDQKECFSLQILRRCVRTYVQSERCSTINNSNSILGCPKEDG